MFKRKLIYMYIHTHTYMMHAYIHTYNVVTVGLRTSRRRTPWQLALQGFTTGFTSSLVPF